MHPVDYSADRVNNSHIANKVVEAGDSPEDFIVVQPANLSPTVTAGEGKCYESLRLAGLNFRVSLTSY